MRFSALLFDLDGTLVDSHHEICLALNAALVDLGLGLDFDRVEELVDGAPLEVIWDKLHPDPTARPAASELERFANAYRSHYMRDLGHASRVFPGVREALDELRTRFPHVPLGVVSNKSASSVSPLLEALDLHDRFALSLGSGGTSMAPKPDPALLLEAARRFACPPERCVMIGDTVFDIQAGKRAGMTTVALSYGMSPREALEAEGADHLLDDFGKLPQVLSGSP